MKNIKKSIKEKWATIGLPTLSQDEILKAFEGIKFNNKTYDQAMDSVYNATHEGGGNHRMFDGGHDVFGAWDKVSGELPDDTFTQEVFGYFKGLWNDGSTIKGLPLNTWEKADYDQFTEWVSGLNLPGVNKSYLYDLLSVDAPEIVGSVIGVCGYLFFLKKNDIENISKCLASMGVISIASANPIMAIFTTVMFSYSYFVKKHEFDKKAAIKSSAVTVFSMGLFSVIGFTGFLFIFEIVLVIYLTKKFKEKIIENEELVELVRFKLPVLVKQYAISIKKRMYEAV